MSTIEFRWADRGGDALVAASGSGAAGRKGRGTVGARVPTVRQENGHLGCPLYYVVGSWLTIALTAISTSKASAPPLVPASRQVRPRSPNCH